MNDRLLDRVARGPLLLDAGMGTRLIAVGLDLTTDDPCLWNLTHPQTVFGCHRRDVAAGAEAVFTNTFGANRAWLARFDRAVDVGVINQHAVHLARGTAGFERFVIGSIGPTAAADLDGLIQQAVTLLGAGVDALALETCRLDQALAMLGSLAEARAVRATVPILVGLYAWPEPLAATAESLLGAGASIVGLNCSADLDLIHRLLDLAAAGGWPVWLKPSATGPDGTSLALDDFARLADRLAERNTGMLGGCCGTTDAEIRTIGARWTL